MNIVLWLEAVQVNAYMLCKCCIIKEFWADAYATDELMP